MKTFFKFRNKFVPINVDTNGGLEFCLLYSDKHKQFSFINPQFREICWRAKNKHIDIDEELPEWECHIFSFPFKTLPKLFKMRFIRRAIEKDYRGFKMI